MPTPSCKLSIEGYDLTSLQQFQANNPVTVTGVVRLGDKFENPEAVLDAEDAHFYYNGEEIPVNLVPAEKLTAETIIAYDADGALHVLIMPEIGTPEAVEESIEQMGDKIGKGNGFLEAIHFFSSTDDDVRQILNLADTVDYLRGKVEEFKASGDFGTAGQTQTEVGATLGELDQQLRNLNEQDIANIGQEAAQLMAALSSGNLDTAQMESYAAELQRIYDLLAVADEVMGEGNPVTQGIADAMSAYDWQGDATTINRSGQYLPLILCEHQYPQGDGDHLHAAVPDVGIVERLGYQPRGKCSDKLHALVGYQLRRQRRWNHELRCPCNQLPDLSHQSRREVRGFRAVFPVGLLLCEER